MSKRALVVDDDRHMARTLGDLLQLKGWDVATALSGTAAVQASEREDFDVVIMDVKMPGMNGVEAFKAMKARKPRIRVVLMTAYAAQDQLAEAEREGVLSVLHKPLDLRALLAILDASLSDERPVLLVDDDEAFLRTLAQVLSVRGYEVVTARDVPHAVALMSERRPLAVLLHFRLRAMPTRDAVVAMRRMSPDTALILYTGMPAVEPARVAEAAGIPGEWVHACLQKPFPIEQVTGVLDELRAHDG